MHYWNPFRDDARFATARLKWGSPVLQGRTETGLCGYVCDECGASWDGPPGDHCRWCAARYETQLARRIAELLYPSWMVHEGPRYHELSDIDKQVWNATRGFPKGRLFGPAEYSDEIYDAMCEGIITKDQAISALERLRTWQRKSTQSNGSMPDTRQTKS